MSILVENVPVDLSMVKMKLMDKEEGEGWEEAYADEVIEEYRKFLVLTKNNKEAIVPSTIVDKVWHHHILDTHAYAPDCERIFGHFLHHFPYFGMRGEQDYHDLQNAFARTLELYEKTFGEAPQHLWKGAGRCPKCGRR